MDERRIKCVVWDLDNTLWKGTLQEGGGLRLRDGAADALRMLDSRGILHSIASRNDPKAALAKLRELDILEYFVCPQIGWGAKSAAVQAIAEELGLSLDAVAFVDDQPFERAEVLYGHPQVLCLEPSAWDEWLQRPELNPRVVGLDGRTRRDLFRNDGHRREAERQFSGPPEAFLATLQIRLTIRRAVAEDLQRAEELTHRTHQFNTTGEPYSCEQLEEFARSLSHRVLILDLEDRYGSQGSVGLALLDYTETCWRIKLFLTSCRVISCGIGAIFLQYIIRCASGRSVRLTADFIRRERNRLMLVTYRLSGFREIDRSGDKILLEHPMTETPSVPQKLTIIDDGQAL